MKNITKSVLAITISVAASSANALEVDLEINANDLNRNNLDWYAPHAQGGVEDVGAGDMEHVDPSMEIGYSLGLSMDLGNNWTGTLRIGSQKFEEKDDVAADFNMVATRVHADWNDVAEEDWDFGTADFELDHQTIDLELAYAVAFGGGKGSISPLIGLRSMNIDQSLDVLYEDTTSADGTTVGLTADTSAVGFFAGVQGNWEINSLVSLEGRVELGTLQASTSREFLEINDDGSSIGVSVKDEFSETLTTSAAKLGVAFNAWQNDKVDLDVSVGYKISSIDGASDFISFPDDVNNGAQSRERQSLGYSGFYLNVGTAF